MTEQTERIEGTFQYTYDNFTVFFYGDRIFIGGKDYPVGQCVVDMMNLDEPVLSDFDLRVREFLPAAQELLKEKTDNAAALAQERLNAVFDIMFTLPGYRDLPLDEKLSYHMLVNLT